MRIKRLRLVVGFVRATALCTALVFVFIIFLEESGPEKNAKRRELRELRHVENALYKAECGSCHLAYPPGLLPERSWVKMMNNLKDHFGTDAQIDVAIGAEITKYLTENSAERGSRRSKKIAYSIPSQDEPLRFTETLFFKMKHSELHDVVFHRLGVVSRTNCLSCHPEAKNGQFYGYTASVPD
jgi:hypothetical protein